MRLHTISYQLQAGEQQCSTGPGIALFCDWETEDQEELKLSNVVVGQQLQIVLLPIGNPLYGNHVIKGQVAQILGQLLGVCAHW